MLSMLEAIQGHLGVPDGDSEVAVGEGSKQHERLGQQIETVTDRKDKDARADAYSHPILEA